jgi:hypothetical protein
MESFSKSASFGKVDKIKGISSCIITGSTCEQGTGLCRAYGNNDYLENKENKNQVLEYIQEEKFYQDQGIGNCFSLGNLQATTYNNDGEEIDVAEGRKYKEEPKVISDTNLCPKENIETPFSMAMPVLIRELIDNTIISFDSSDDEQVTNIASPEPIPKVVDDAEEIDVLDFKL